LIDTVVSVYVTAFSAWSLASLIVGTPCQCMRRVQCLHFLSWTNM